MGERLDRDDALQVDHFADASVDRERIADDEQVLVERLVDGQHSHLADGPDSQFRLRPCLDRLKPLRLGVDQGFELNFTLGGRQFHAIDSIFRVASLSTFHRPGIAELFSGLLRRDARQLEQQQRIVAAVGRTAVRHGPNGHPVGPLVDTPDLLPVGDLIAPRAQVPAGSS